MTSAKVYCDVDITDHLRKIFPGNRKSFALDVGYHEGETYPDGTSVAEVAIIQEYGAVIEHPGGTKYIKDAVTSRMVLDPETGKRKRVYSVGVRFVANNFSGDAFITGPHQIVIPARPFFSKAFEINKRKWIANFESYLVSSGYNLEKAFKLLGAVVRSDIIHQIDITTEPPNAPSTLRQKKGSHPLIDTHRMRNRIKWQVTTL